MTWVLIIELINVIELKTHFWDSRVYALFFMPVFHIYINLTEQKDKKVNSRHWQGVANILFGKKKNIGKQLVYHLMSLFLYRKKILTTYPLGKTHTRMIKFIQLKKLSFKKASLHCPFFSHFPIPVVKTEVPTMISPWFLDIKCSSLAGPQLGAVGDAKPSMSQSWGEFRHRTKRIKCLQ